MTTNPLRSMSSRFTSDFGMLFVLLVLCAYYGVVTWQEQYPTSPAAGGQLADDIIRQFGPEARVLIVARDSQEDAAFADALRDRFNAAGLVVVASIKGQPADARRALQSLVDAGDRLDVIATNHFAAGWAVFENVTAKFPSLANVRIVQPPSYWWPNFLKTNNLLNIADQISVIAILAIGMTFVIITGGIDLSVGSLVALSAVVATRLVRDFAGAEQASDLALVGCCLGGIALCAVVGAFSGLLVAQFKIPAFIATLAMMLVASGMAYIVAQGRSVGQLPDRFVWLGRGDDLFRIPNGVVLMLILYAVAHVLMTHMALGRYIYAVGGNIEAARLSGVRVGRVLVFAYVVCGALAGLGGIVTASQLKSGSPTYGLMYELYTIAAVVVGGTSLRGGQGKILGTLIGAFIIAVIRNGMNLTDVEAYKQNIVLGLVILGAVLLDTVKKRGWKQTNR